MHLRKLVVACGLATLTMSNLATALGLGEVKLKSTLNQPLSAEVQLLDTKGLSEDQILVSLASPAEFERNGVERLYFYSEFKFQVDLNAPSGPVIKVTSKNPVREPYLNFLIEAKWASGRLLREYTLLMDLPTFNDAPARTAVQSAQSPSQAAAVKKVERQVAVPSPAPSAAQMEETPDVIAQNDKDTAKPSVKKTSEPQGASSGTYGPIGERDTLWDIAKSVRADSSVSVHQTMLALHRLNPDAFIRGNINLIKKGQVLRVPDAAEATSISKSEAATQFAALSNSPSGTSASSTEMGAQLDATRHSSAAKRSEEPGSGRVKLAAPESAEKSSGGGQGSGSNKGASKALERELATTLEELDRAKSEKSELSSRVRDLEEQVKTMQKLVDVSSEKLRTMQTNAQKAAEVKKADAKAAEAKVADTKAAESKLETKIPATEPQQQAVTSVANSSAAVSEPAKPAEVAAPKPKKQVKKPVEPEAPPEASLVDVIMENIVPIGAGAGILALGAGALVMRRRKAQEAESNQSQQTGFEEDTPDLSSFNNEFDDSSSNELDVAQDEMSLFEEEAPVTEAETGDVVGEADIYIAYGKFDQAEEMLLNGLKKDPASTDIRMKLLEVYSQTQNLTEFDKHYAVILPLAAGFMLSRAAELRAEIPGAGVFEQSLAVGESQIQGNDGQDEFALDDLELDTFDETVVDGIASEAPSVREADEFSLDLDDLELGDLDKPSQDYQMNSDSTASLTSTDLDDEFVLDFDDADAEKLEAEFGDLNLALEDSDADLLEEELEPSKIADEEFSFDFKELDDSPLSLADEVDAIKTSDFEDSLEQGDEFNFDVDVQNADLAALDKEFDSLDGELDLEPLAEAQEFVGTSTGASFDADSLNIEDLEKDLDFSLEGFDEELSDLQTVNSASVAQPSEGLLPDFDETSLELEGDSSLALDDELTLDFAEAGNTELGDLDSELVDLENAYKSDFNTLDDQNGESIAVDDDLLLADSFESEQDLTLELADLEVGNAEPLSAGAEEFAVDADDFSLEDLDLGDVNAELEAELSAFDASESTSLDLSELDESSFEKGSLGEEALNFDAEFDSLAVEGASADFASLDDDLVLLDEALEAPVNSFDGALELPVELDQLDVDSTVPVLAESDLGEAVVPELSDEDDMFEQALSDFSAEDFNVDNLDEIATETDDDLDFMAEADEAATKLDLARAYMDMGDNEGARDILAEVAHEGNEDQRKEAEDLLTRIDA